MLSLGKWGPFTFEKITSNATGQFVAEVKDRDQTRGYFTARIASSGKIAYLSFGVPSMSNSFAEQVLKAHLAAMNRRDPAIIHAFVTTYCEPSMQPVEKTMLALGADGPYTLEQISSNSDGAVIADIANGRQEHCYLSAYFDSKYKVKELILSQL